MGRERLDSRWVSHLKNEKVFVIRKAKERVVRAAGLAGAERPRGRKRLNGDKIGQGR